MGEGQASRSRLVCRRATAGLGLQGLGLTAWVLRCGMASGSAGPRLAPQRHGVSWLRFPQPGFLALGRLRALRAVGRPLDDQMLAHISPGHNENIGFYGTFSFEVGTELSQLVAGYRPLRQVSP